MSTGKDLVGGEKSADLSLEVTREITPMDSSPKGQKVVPQKRFCGSCDKPLLERLLVPLKGDVSLGQRAHVNNPSQESKEFRLVSPKSP